MAIVRRTLQQISAESDKDVDWTQLQSTTEDDIRRHMIEDGQDPDEEPTGYLLVEPPQAIRKRLGMTQEEFAEALRVPLATLRNWEQGRFTMDPAVKSLLRIVSRNPEAAFAALAA